MAKKKRRSAKQRAATRRMVASNKRSKKRHSGARKARKARKNPARRRKTRHVGARRARRANPGRRYKRRHSRNPMPTWAMGAFALVGAIASYAIGTAGSFALTQRTDPTLGTLERNRYLLTGAVTVGGLALMMVSPMLGLGVAAGGAAALAGTQASLALGKVIDKRDASGQLQTARTTAGAVNDGGRQQFAIGAISDRGRQEFGLSHRPDRQLMSAIEDGGRQYLGGFSAFDRSEGGYFGG